MPIVGESMVSTGTMYNTGSCECESRVIVYRPIMVFGVSIKLGTTAAYECTTTYIPGMYFSPLTALIPQCGMLRKSMKVWIKAGRG